MTIISKKIRYVSHNLNTRFHACKTYSNKTFSIKDISKIYHFYNAYLMGWVQLFDWIKVSLKFLYKRPHTPHPNAHTSDEIKHIEDLLRMNPYIGLSELYGKLKRNYSYNRHPASLFSFLRKKGIYVTPEATKPKYETKPYDTPKAPGEKLQLDVKYVPKVCYKGSDGAKFY